MIMSPQSSVTPNQDLVKLTLMTSPAAEKIRRKSTIGSASRPSLGHIDGREVIGPAGPPITGSSDVFDGEAVQSPTCLVEANNAEAPAPFGEAKMAEQQTAQSLPEAGRSDIDDMDTNIAEDNSSEATLVTTPQSVDDSMIADASLKDQQQHILEDKENLAPPKQQEPVERPSSPEKATIPLHDTSPSKLNAQAGADMPITELAQIISDEDKKSAAIPPNRPPPIPPRPTPQIAAPTLEDYARQQDVTEVIDHTLFQLSCAIKPMAVDKDGNQIDQVHDLFFGKRKTHVLNDQPAQTKEEEFYSIICRLEARPHDIYAALDGAFDLSETPGGSSRYESLSRAPPVFQVCLDRLGFDPVTKRAGKLHHYVELKETIYLDRYLEADVESQLMERRQQVWAWKKQLAEIQARKDDLTANESHPDAVSTFKNARQIMLNLQEIAIGEDADEIDVPSATIATLESLAEQTQAELDSLDKRARDLFQQIETNFTDMRKYPYCLHAAFFHRGTDASGHYWVYIYDFKKEIWRKYNDGYVTEVKDTNEIFRAPSEADKNSYSGPPNPYVVIYVRSDIKDELVESVHREIVFPPRQPTPPLEHQVDPAGGDGRMTDDAGAAGTNHIEHASSAPSWPSEPQPQPAIPPTVNFDLRGADIRTKW
jgi:ubiquitin carboxyl-terminal hydrolase 25/28